MEAYTIQEGVTDFKTLSVGRIVAHNYRTADVFKKYNIDFCCGGKASVQEACNKKNINVSALIDELIATLSTPSMPSQNYNSWDAGFLADYITNTHHNYVRISTDILDSYLKKLVRVHGDRHPELTSIHAYFTSLAGELLPHMEKEDHVLFPFIKQLANGQTNETHNTAAMLEGPLNCMEKEHDHAGKMMALINELTSGYTAPEDACTTYRVCYMKLKEFEADLFQHVHLENNILFPKALAMAQKTEQSPELTSCTVPINFHSN